MRGRRRKERRVKERKEEREVRQRTGEGHRLLSACTREAGRDLAAARSAALPPNLAPPISTTSPTSSPLRSSWSTSSAPPGSTWPRGSPRSPRGTLCRRRPSSPRYKARIAIGDTAGALWCIVYELDASSREGTHYSHWESTTPRRRLLHAPWILTHLFVGPSLSRPAWKNYGRSLSVPVAHHSSY